MKYEHIATAMPSETLLERRIDAVRSTLERSQSTWARQHWRQVMRALMRKMKNKT